MKNGRLFINEQAVPRTKVDEQKWLTESGWQDYTHYTEILPNGFIHDIYELNDHMPLDDTDPVFVPEGYYFMMGDNRDNSQDSRYFGLVPEELLEGKARFIFYSTNGDGWFFQFWRWPSFVRLKRMFTEIH